MGGFGDFFDTVVTVGSLGLVNPGADDAADAQVASQNRQIEATDRQFEQTRADNLPFLEAGTGALSDFQNLINKGPKAPTVPIFNGEAVAAPTLDRFNGSAVNAPTLNQFTNNSNIKDFDFDVNKVLDSPRFNFMREQGEIQQDRVAGKNRNLGSGQRLIDAAKFGQGLATDEINNEFNRQLTEVQQNNQSSNQRFNNDFTTNQANNLTAGNQFDFNNQNLQSRISLNDLANNQAIQQQGLNRQNLNDRMTLDNLNNSRTLQNFNLENDQFNSRLNRLAGLIDVGRGTGTALGNFGANATNSNNQNIQNMGDIRAAQELAPVNSFLNFVNTGANVAGAFNK